MVRILNLTLPKDRSPAIPEDPTTVPPEDVTSADRALDLANALNDALLPERANHMLERALELNNNHAGAVSELGRTYLDAGRADDTDALFTGFLEAHPDRAEARLEYARCLLRMARLEDAVRQCRRCMDDRPNWDAPHVPLIMALSRLGRSAEARAILEDLDRFAPDSRTVDMLEKVIARRPD